MTAERKGEQGSKEEGFEGGGNDSDGERLVGGDRDEEEEEIRENRRVGGWQRERGMPRGEGRIGKEKMGEGGR